jgi:UDP-N-acetylmuramate--alanine ligase
MKQSRIVNFSSFKRLYFVGIKGIAMTALAVWAKEQGIKITGSDVAEEFPSDIILQENTIPVLAGFSEKHIQDYRPDAVIYTGAHSGRANIEVVAAQNLDIPVMSHGEALGVAMAGKRQISIAGSHGKTTASAMIATTLVAAGLDPSYAIGCGEIRGLGFPGHFGRGNYFVAEADEYVTDPTHDRTPRFLWQRPDILVVTNIDFDHPDAYSSLSQVQEAFKKLQHQQTGAKITIVNLDDPASKILAKDECANVITYGVSDSATYQAESVLCEEGATTFTIKKQGKPVGVFTIRVPGKHNVANALAAAVACDLCHVPWKVIAEGLLRFEGAKRRFEKIGILGKTTFYDDYAHHPREIRATLAAMRSWYPNDRIIAVFQPHTYSRTKSLMNDFGKAFGDADSVIITDIYASAREHNTLGISGSTVAREIKKYRSHVLYAPEEKDIVRALSGVAKEASRVVFMGAGNIYLWGKDIVARMQSV